MSHNNNNPYQQLTHLGLGQQQAYPQSYDASLLQIIPRTLNRQAIELDESALPFFGEDRWTAFELSWLTPSGKPQVAILQCQISADSINMVESKSFKYYLNGFNQAVFANHQVVQAQIQADLQAAVVGQVSVSIIDLDDYPTQLATLPGQCIDHHDLACTTYEYQPELLVTTSNQKVDEQLYSHLFRSNCLITNQPDWASVYIHYQGPQICHASLLAYLVSFRQHNEFHEQCVERIYRDILRHCQPSKLTVMARFTRRGGLDINPFRSNFESPMDDMRLARQ